MIPIRVTSQVTVVEPVSGLLYGNFIELGFGRQIEGMREGPAGTTIRIRHAEMIYPDGRLMTENLRKARATDTFILRGDAAGES